MKYHLNIFWDDIKISDFETRGDTPECIYEEYSNDLLRKGLEKGMPLHILKRELIGYCDEICKRKRHCEKIKAVDHCLFLSAFFSLHKLNYQPTYDSYIFLKHKTKSKKVRRHPKKSYEGGKR